MNKATLRTAKTWHRLGAVIGVTLTLTSCSALLPRGESTTESPWHSFEEAKAMFETITPYQTKTDQLKSLGIDPFVNPNVTILTYSDILRRFVPNIIARPDDLDGGIRDCIAAMELCRGYEVDHKQTKRKRYGNFWLDFFNFKRKTEVSGWRFNAVIVSKGDLVVYKLWSGQPLIHELEENRNPLGPLQGFGETSIRIW